jgi:hypothetical protein
MDLCISENQNLFSISGIDESFAGISRFRRIVAFLLKDASFAVVEAHRPNTFAVQPAGLNGNLADSLLNLNHDDDWFSCYFEYRIQENNDELVDLFSNLWFTYEQPALIIVRDTLYPNKRVLALLRKRVSWKETTSSTPCIVVHKGVEEDVLWVGKSEKIDIVWSELID